MQRSSLYAGITAMIFRMPLEAARSSRSLLLVKSVIAILFSLLKATKAIGRPSTTVE